MKSTSVQSKGNDPFFQFAENLFRTLFHGGVITIQGLRLLFKKANETPYGVSIATLGWFLTSLVIGGNLYHLRFLHWLWPEVFSGWIMRWFVSFSVSAHMTFLFAAGVLGYAFVLGLRERRSATQIKRGLEAIGLTDSFGQVPKLLGTHKTDEYREKMVFMADSFGLERFESKRSQLEATLQKKISSITHGKNPAFVEVHFNSKEIPTLVTNRELEERDPLLRLESFYVGETTSGVIDKCLPDLPHLLIAGTTGGGKSVFFKQVLYSLLKTSGRLQMYLIDLKGGLEFSDFKEAPNVRVIKTMDEAVTLLEAIEREMHARFKFLEKIGEREIRPVHDEMDRFVVAIDEASILYANRSIHDDDSELAKRARQVTDAISKLGRAAGIHLILATQKVSKETIDTAIQENVSARMCFKMNTLNGSLTMLGSKDAMDLPQIPGRAIWLNGNERWEVQAPVITSEEIRTYCKEVKREFDKQIRVLCSPMLGTPKENPGLKTLLQIVPESVAEEGDMNAE